MKGEEAKIQHAALLKKAVLLLEKNAISIESLMYHGSLVFIGQI